MDKCNTASKSSVTNDLEQLKANQDVLVSTVATLIHQVTKISDELTHMRDHVAQFTDRMNDIIKAHNSNWIKVQSIVNNHAKNTTEEKNK